MKKVIIFQPETYQKIFQDAESHLRNVVKDGVLPEWQILFKQYCQIEEWWNDAVKKYTSKSGWKLNWIILAEYPLSVDGCIYDPTHDTLPFNLLERGLIVLETIPFCVTYKLGRIEVALGKVVNACKTYIANKWNAIQSDITTRTKLTFYTARLADAFSRSFLYKKGSQSLTLYLEKFDPEQDGFCRQKWLS